MIKQLKLSDRRYFILCAQSENTRQDQNNQYQNDETPFELNGIIWEIYFSMLRNNRLFLEDEKLQQFNRIEIKNNLETLEYNGLIKKKEDKYELIEDKKLTVVLLYLLRKDKYSQMRLVFYFSFLIASLLLFIIYKEHMPHNFLTTTYLYFFSSLLSISAITIELIKNMQLMSLYKKII